MLVMSTRVHVAVNWKGGGGGVGWGGGDGDKCPVLPSPPSGSCFSSGNGRFSLTSAVNYLNLRLYTMIGTEFALSLSLLFFFF